MKSKRGCSIQGCKKAHVARGWCSGHYQVAVKEGRRPRKPTIEERFWAKVHKSDSCWLWTGAVSDNGYGSFDFESRRHQAHRISFLFTKGMLPLPTLDLDHLCRVRNCVNPDHLEPVTRSENMKRGMAFKREKLSQVGYGV